MRLLITLLFITTLLFSKELPTIVPLSWLKDNMNNPNLVILDIREYEDYKKGHIKGAVNIPGLKNLFDEQSWKVPKLDFLKTLFSNAGIDHNSEVVVYDNGEFFWAARAYWILEILGHSNVGILKYAYGKEIEKNFPTSTQDSVVTKKEFVPRIDNGLIETKLSTLLSIGKKNDH